MRSTFSRLVNRPSFHEPVVDGVRAIAILWVFIFHIFTFQLGTFPEQVMGILTTWSTNWIAQGPLGVDLFFRD